MKNTKLLVRVSIGSARLGISYIKLEGRRSLGKYVLQSNTLMIFFEYFTIGKPEDIRDLRAISSNTSVSRNEIPIAVVDNEEFEWEDELRRCNFFINQYEDVSSIRDLSEYPIVLCDIDGVGQNFGSDYEGAYIIKELKRRYPNKIIVAYSAYSFKPDYNEYFEMADFYFDKDRGFDKWEESLDESIRLATDPIEQWKKIRNFLISQEVPLYTIFKLEQGYIESVKSGSENELIDKIESSDMPEEVKNSINNVASAAFFSLLS